MPVSKLQLNTNTKGDEAFVTHKIFKFQHEEDIIAQDFKTVITY